MVDRNGWICTHTMLSVCCISLQLLKERVGNDRYTDRGMQTINFSAKFKQIQTEPIKKTVNKIMMINDFCTNYGVCFYRSLA